MEDDRGKSRSFAPSQKFSDSGLRMTNGAGSARKIRRTLLLTEATGLAVALLLIPALVYAPFAQATLVRSAYAGEGGAR